MPHVYADLTVSFRQRTDSATAPLPLMPTPNSAFGSTVAPHERQRRRREVSSSSGTTWNLFCERVEIGANDKQCIAWADFQTAGLNGVFGYFCRHGQKYLAPEREIFLPALASAKRLLCTAKYPKKESLLRGFLFAYENRISHPSPRHPQWQYAARPTASAPRWRARPS